MKNHLILGDWNVLCDSCGRKFKASQVQKRWDGLMVCKEDWEMRHPQDFLRVQKERIAVPFSRPYPAQDTFIPWNYTQRADDALGLVEVLTKIYDKRIGLKPSSSALGGLYLNQAPLNAGSTSIPDSAEQFQITESLLVVLARFLTDNPTLTETFAKSITKRFSDTVSLAESLYFAEQEHNADTLSLSETATKQTGKVATDTLSITESTSYKFVTRTVLDGAPLNTQLLG